MSLCSNFGNRYGFRVATLETLLTVDLSDYKTDTAIQSSLRHEMQDVTQIIIAHRLQSIIDADKIVSAEALDLHTFLNIFSRWCSTPEGL
jgi:hypothetical protein